MSWQVDYLPEVEKDFRNLDESQKILVRKAIRKISSNPLSQTEGGYGKPLGNKRGKNLTGFLKVKLRGAGIRVVYKLVKKSDTMLVVVIGAREEEEVYEMATKRGEKYNL